MSRAKWKIPVINELIKKKNVYIQQRHSIILPLFNNSRVMIHSGNKLNFLNINLDKIGHKFGEFILTRKFHVYKKDKVKN
jgi:ribosomal protein S19